MKTVYIITYKEAWEAREIISVHETKDGAKAAAIKYLSRKEPDTGFWTRSEYTEAIWTARGGLVRLEVEEWGVNQ